MLYNNQSPYTICLLVPNKEALKRHLEHKHLGLDTPEATREALHILDKELQHYKGPVSYTHIRAHETVLDLVCRLLLDKKKNKQQKKKKTHSSAHITINRKTMSRATPTHVSVAY